MIASHAPTSPIAAVSQYTLGSPFSVCMPSIAQMGLKLLAAWARISFMSGYRSQ